jgi:hypothetical protein
MTEPRVANVTCAKCGYALRGLDVAGQCPECGMAIAESLHGFMLRFADAAWLNRIHRGMKLLRGSRIAIGTCVVAMLFFVIAGLLLIESSKDTLLERVFEVIMGAISTVACLLMLVIGIGAWLASSPEPRETSDPPDILRTISYFASPVIVPLFGLVLVSQRQLNMMLPTIASELIVHVFVLIVWLHMQSMVKVAIELCGRSELSDEHMLNSLHRQRTSAKIVPLLLLFVYWTGFVRWSRAGQWTLPTYESQRMLVGILGLCWLAATGSFVSAKACVDVERKHMKIEKSET